MEHKLLIKSIRSIKSNKKVYILYEQAPSDDLTGGIWFNDGEIDQEFVTGMTKVVQTFIDKKSRSRDKNSLCQISSLPNIKEISMFISETKVSSVPLTLEDIKTLMDVMVADGLVQEVSYNKETHYRSINQENAL